jgi:hypothetical protein
VRWQKRPRPVYRLDPFTAGLYEKGERSWPFPFFVRVTVFEVIVPSLQEGAVNIFAGWAEALSPIIKTNP